MHNEATKILRKMRKHYHGCPPGYSKRNQNGFTLTEVGIVLGVMGFLLSGIWTAYDTVLRELRVAHMARDISYIANALQNIGTTNPGYLNLATDTGVTIIMTHCTGTAVSGFFGTGCSAGQATGAYASSQYGGWNGDDLTSIAITTGSVPNNLVGSGTLISPWGAGAITNYAVGTNDVYIPANASLYNSSAVAASNSGASSIHVPPAVPGTVYMGGEFFITFYSVPSKECASLLEGYGGNFLRQGLTRFGTIAPQGYLPNEYNFDTHDSLEHPVTPWPSLDTIEGYCTQGGTTNEVTLGLFFTNSH